MSRGVIKGEADPSALYYRQPTEEGKDSVSRVTELTKVGPRDYSAKPIGLL
jgi:hypothetical protein